MTICKRLQALWVVLRCAERDLDELLYMLEQLGEFREDTNPVIRYSMPPVPTVKHKVRFVNKGWGKPTRVRDEDSP